MADGGFILCGLRGTRGEDALISRRAKKRVDGAIVGEGWRVPDDVAFD